MNDHSNPLLAAADLLQQASHLALLDMEEAQLIQLLAVLDCKVDEIEARLAELRTEEILAVASSVSRKAADHSAGSLSRFDAQRNL